MVDNSEIYSPSIKRRSIEKVSLFSCLPKSELERLENLIKLKEFKKGSSIITSFSEGKDIMFVVDGEVDVKKTGADGKEVILSRLSVGSFFGEIAFLTGVTRSADVTAADDAIVLIISASDFSSFLDKNPQFARALMTNLAHRVSAASSKISDLALLDVYCRVERTLRSLARISKNDGSLIIKNKPTHKDLAAMVGTSREMVTRALGKLEENGVIASNDDKITIVN